VWKLQVEEGDVAEADQVLSILEAMKLEIAVKIEESMVGGTVEKLLVRQGDVVSAGKAMLKAMLLTKKKS
jgi:biotin carboxyl carrier protein